MKSLTKILIFIFTISSLSFFSSLGFAKAKTYRMGETVKANKMLITVHKVERSIGGRVYKPMAGNEFIYLNVSFENQDSHTRGSTGVSLKDGEGNQYNYKMYERDRGYETAYVAAIQPGNKKTGWLCFEIPKGKKGLIFQFNSGFKASFIPFSKVKSEVVNIALD